MTAEDKVSLAQKRAKLVALLEGAPPREELVRLQGELSIVNAKIKALNTTEAARLKAEADRRKIAGLTEAQANAARARAKVGGCASGSAEDDDPTQTIAIDAWIAGVLEDSGVKARRTRDGLDFGDVPAKWLVILQRLRAGIHAAARGQKLPDAEEPPTKPTKKR